VNATASVEGYEISLDGARVQIDRVHRALAASYWSPGIRREVLVKAVSRSLVVGAYVRGTGEQVGFARVVTDCATFAWLCDVYVDEAHGKRGLAKAMVRTLVQHPELQTLRRMCLATRDAHSLYEPFGFTPVPAERWMERRLPVAAWSQHDGA
jgi:GNAT superfamily N-acetyltransferase